MIPVSKLILLILSHDYDAGLWDSVFYMIAMQPTVLVLHNFVKLENMCTNT